MPSLRPVHKITVKKTMIKRGSISLLLVLCCFLTTTAQITVRFPEPKKATYAVGETVVVQVCLKCAPETCLDGMKQSKVFLSGLEIKHETDWKQLSKGVFRKNMELIFLKSKKNTAKLTLLRKSDKDDLFKQEVFFLKIN
jgi:hypothetical protein